MTIRRRYQVLLLIFICLGLYYPAIFNTTLSIDDTDMITRMNAGHFSWTGLFSPRSSFYYRPLLILTFWVDKWLWDFAPTFSLLENILLHAANTLLVFSLIEQCVTADSKNRYLSFVGALIFAVHPIATESINWMSGRTDLLATFFVLLSAVLLLKSLQRGSYLYLMASLGIYLCGIMSKEVVVFFFPAGLYLILIWGRGFSVNGFRRLWQPLVLYVSPVLCGVLGYILLRLIREGSSARSLTALFNRIPYDWLDYIRVSLKVFGFYAKKLVIPVPLNFAIVQFSDWYALVGGAVLLFLCWMLLKNSIKWSFLVISLYMILPAIIIALTNVAWTPVAERYIYLSAAFFCAGLVMAVKSLLVNRNSLRIAVLLLFIWVVPASVVTAQRSALWADKEAFYADTLKKSPNFARLRNEYGVALLGNHKGTEALGQFQQGQSSKGTYLALVNEARLLLIDGEYEKGRAVLLDRFPDLDKMRLRALKMLVQIDAKRLGNVSTAAEREKISAEMFAIHSQIYKKTKDPFYLYRSGQLALQNGDKRKAQELFSKAYTRSSDAAHYKIAAGKLAIKLEKELR